MLAFGDLPRNFNSLAACRDFITPVLVDALLIARKIGPQTGRLELVTEMEFFGRKAWGPIDYVALFKTFAVIFGEVNIVSLKMSHYYFL